MKPAKTLTSKVRNALFGVALAAGSVYAATQASDNFQFDPATNYPLEGMYVPIGGISGEFSTLGIVNKLDVLRATPEAEQIADGKLKKNTPDYDMAIVAINNRFQDAVETFADKKGYDSIIEESMLEGYHFLSVPESYRLYNDRGRLIDGEGKKYDVDMKTLMQTPKYGGVNVTDEIAEMVK